MCNMTKEAPGLSITTDAFPLAVADAAVQIAGQDTNRRSVTVINDPDGTGSVYICGALGQRYTSGIKLKPGASITLDIIGPVFCCAPTVAATVYVLTVTGSQL